MILKRLCVWAAFYYVFVDLIYDYYPEAWSYDKIWHFLALFSYALALLDLPKTKSRNILIFISPALFEMVQVFTPHHSFEWADMFTNYLGTLTAILLWQAFTRFDFKFLKT